MTDYREVLGISELSEEANDGEGIKVAVIDTGIPHIDDILVCYSANTTAESGRDTGHATFIGSMLFGRGCVHGICPKATACFIKVFEQGFSKPDNVARAILQAVDSWHVDLINLSLGFSRSNPCPKSVRKACQHAAECGVILVAASGNDGGESLWPAALPEVISVGSTDGKQKESFSNHGEVDFVVPGRDLIGQDANGMVTTKTGTSFSTAIISGMLALLAAVRKREGLVVSPDAVKNDLIQSCTDIHTTGWDEMTGFGIPFMPVKRTHPTVKSIRLLATYIFDKIKGILRAVVKSLKRRKL